MLYQFQCTTCEHIQEEIFSAADYDKKVNTNGRLKRRKCENCGSITLYRHIIKMPDVMGGTRGYVSMERYWANNAELAKTKQDNLNARMSERFRKRVLDNIDKQAKRSNSNDRHKDYGEGCGETKLKTD